ncbi:MAG: hypothetical protein V1849_04685 [Chloroflexota bacterium]
MLISGKDEYLAALIIIGSFVLLVLKVESDVAKSLLLTASGYVFGKQYGKRSR